MKKTFYYLFMSFAAMAMSASFVACGGDDEEDGGTTGGSSQSAASSTITTVTGNSILLESITSRYDNTIFTYDNNGRPVKISEDNDQFGYKFTYNPFTITLIEDYDDEDSRWEETIAGTLNAKGYISSLTTTESDDDEMFKSTSYIDYDGEGRIIKVRSKWTESGYDEGEYINYNGTSAFDYTWKDGNLVKIESLEDGEDYYYKEVIEIKYGNQKNQYAQYTIGISEAVAADVLCMVGLCGKGSANLPVSVEFSEIEYDKYNDKEYKYTQTDAYEYTLNNDGTIATEKENSTLYTYNYVDSKSAGNNKAPKMESADNGVKTKKKFRPFTKRHKRH